MPAIYHLEKMNKKTQSFAHHQSPKTSQNKGKQNLLQPKQLHEEQKKNTSALKITLSLLRKNLLDSTAVLFQLPLQS